MFNYAKELCLTVLGFIMAPLYSHLAICVVMVMKKTGGSHLFSSFRNLRMKLWRKPTPCPRWMQSASFGFSVGTGNHSVCYATFLRAMNKT